jgi:ankyrin repeat protein
MSTTTAASIDASLLVEQLRKVLLLSASPSSTDRQDALRLLARAAGGVSSAQHCREAVKQAAHEVLCDILASARGSPQIQFESAKGLAALASHEPVRAGMGASDKLVQALIATVYRAPEMVKRQVAKTLALLTAEPANHARLVTMGVVRPLDALVRFDNDECRRQAMRAVSHLASPGGAEQARLHVVATGMIAEVVNLLAHPSTEVSSEAARCLGAVCVSGGGPGTEAVAADAARAVPALLNIIAAAEFKDDETATRTGGKPALIALSRVLATFRAAELAAPIAACCAEGGASEPHVRALAAIVELLGSLDMALEGAAVAACAGLSAQPAGRSALLRAFSLEPLTGHARSGAYARHLYGSLAIANFSLDVPQLGNLAAEVVGAVARTAERRDKIDHDAAPVLAAVVEQISAVPQLRVLLGEDLATTMSKLRVSDTGAFVSAADAQAQQQQQQQQQQQGGAGGGDIGSSGSASGSASAGSATAGTVPDDLDWTDLHEAACLGHLSKIKALIASLTPEALLLPDQDGLTALHTAATWGHAEVVAALARTHLFMPSLADTQGRTALHAAANSGHAAVCTLLIQELGCDPSALDNDLNTPLHLAAAHGHDDATSVLLAGGAPPFKRNRQHRTAYILAMDHNYPHTAELLCSLNAAVRNGNFAALEYILSTMGRDVNARSDDNGWTALHEACAIGNLQMVKFLLERGAKVEMTTPEGATCFHLACGSGSRETVQFITPLVKKAIPGFHVDTPGEKGRTGYLEAALHGRAQLCKWLVGSRKADVAAREAETESSALHLACAAGKGECAGELIDRVGCDDTWVDAQGRTCYDVASPETLAYLKSRNFDSSDLLDAIRAGDLDTVKSMLEPGSASAAAIDINRCKGGEIPLLEAARSGHAHVAEYLVARGAAVDARDPVTGETVLHCCARNDAELVAIAMLRAGAPKYTRCKPAAAGAGGGGGGGAGAGVGGGSAGAGLTPHEVALETGSVNVAPLVAPLHCAVRDNVHRVVDTVLYAGEDRDAAHPEILLTAAQVAADQDSARMVRRLARHGVNLDAGCPATRACRAGHVQAMRALFEQHVDANEIAPTSALRGGDWDKHRSVAVGTGLFHTDTVGRGGTAGDKDLDDIEGADAAAAAAAAAADTTTTNNNTTTSTGPAGLCATQARATPALSYDVNAGTTLLHHAVLCGSPEAAAVAVEYGAAKNAGDANGDTAFEMCQSELVVPSAALRAEFARVFSDPHIAAAGGILADVIDLVEAEGCEIGALDSKGRTLLHHAARRDQVEVVEYLVAEGADIGALDAQGQTALHAACLGGASEAAAVLLEHIEEQGGAELLASRTLADAQGRTPFLLGARGGVTPDLLEVLMTLDPAGAAAAAASADERGNNALHQAAMGGHPAAVEFLLEESRAVPYVRNAAGMSPYDLAVEYDQIECAVMLSTLHRAVASGDLEVVEAHVRNGADVCAFDEDTGETPLHVAARLGFAEISRVLVKAGADPHAASRAEGAHGTTPLHAGAGGGHVRSLVAMFERMGSADANVRDARQSTPLHAAALHNCAEACRTLLGYGADANLVDADGRTAYMVAIENGGTEAALVLGDLHRCLASGNKAELEMLLKSGIGVDALNADGLAALHVAVRMDDQELAGYLLENGASANVRDRQGNTPLHHACELGLAEMVELLLEHGADPNIQNERARETALHVAVRAGRADIIRMLLAAGARTNVLNADGQTPYQLALSLGLTECALLVGDLIAAVIGGDINEVRSLLDGGADPNVRDAEEGWTPLHHAVYQGFKDIAALLIERGARVDELDLAGETPLHVACLSGSLAAAKLLVAAGCNINARDQDGCTPLHLACAAGELALARFLLESGADASIQDLTGCTPLHHAVLNGNAEIVRLLLDFGVATDIRTAEGLTALDIAMQGGHKDCVALLVDIGSFVHANDLASLQKWLELGANPDRRDAAGLTPLHHACILGHTEMALALLKHGADPNLKDNTGSTPLHHSTVHGHAACARAVLDHKADPNPTDLKHRTPLHLACATQNHEMVSLLINASANVDARDAGGWTGLHLGACHDAYDVVRALLRGRADRHIVNGDGVTPCDMAVGKRVAELLLSLHDSAARGDIEEGKRLVAVLSGAQIDQREVDGDRGWTPCHVACDAGHEAYVQWIVGEGAGLAIGDRAGLVALHAAAAAGRTAAGIVLIDVGSAPVDPVEALGRTPLHLAAMGGHTEFVAMLLARGAGIDTQDSLGNTALHYAMLHGHAETVAALLQAGARTDLRNNDGQTAYMMAYSQGHLECAGMINDLVSACRCGNLGHIMRMLDSGMDPNTRGLDGSTALHEACRNGHAEVVSALLKAGATVDARDNDGATPLCVALYAAHLDCAELCLTAGADISIRLNDGGTCLHAAAAGGFVPCAARCLAGGIDVNAQDDRGRAPLHIACLMGNADMVEYLLQNGADVSLEDIDGFTALNYALRAGPAGQATVDVLMQWLERARTEADRKAELEYAMRSAEFEGDDMEWGGDEIGQVLSLAQLSRLCRFASSDDLEAQHSAARSLSNLSTNASNQVRIVQAGGLLLLLKLCKSNFACISFQATRSASNLSAHPTNKQIMVTSQKDITQELINIATTGNVALKRQAIRGLSNAASSEENVKLALVDMGVIKAFVAGCYCSGIYELQRQALRGMSAISRSPATHEAMLDAAVLESIAHVVREVEPAEIDPVARVRILLQAAWSLGNLCESFITRESVVDLGLHAFLVRVLHSPCPEGAEEVHPVAVHHAMRALASLAQTPELHHSMLELGAGTVFTAVLRHCDDEAADIKAPLCQAIVGFSAHMKTRHLVFGFAALDPLVAFIAAEDERTRLYASAAIVYLAQPDRRSEELRASDEAEFPFPEGFEARPAPKSGMATQQATAVSVLNTLKATSEAPEIAALAGRFLELAERKK